MFKSPKINEKWQSKIFINISTPVHLHRLHILLHNTVQQKINQL